VDREAGAEFLGLGDAVDQRVLEIAAHVVVGLHRDDVGAVRKQQQVFRHLEVVSAGVLSCGEEIDRLQRTRIGRIQDCHAVAEHVSDIDVVPIEHHLHAVGASADVAVRDVLDALADALGRNVCL
jgi:hypothetical protein